MTAAEDLAHVLVPASLVAAALAVASLLAVVVVSRSPRLGGHVGPTSQLGPEPPAVANALLRRARPDDDAIVGTLVDLVARRHLEIEQRPGGDVFVRARSVQLDRRLDPFERMLLDHVEARARDGACPAAALSVGPAGLAGPWRKLFGQQVLVTATQAGLTRRRYGRRHLAGPGALAGAAMGLGIAALIATSSGTTTPMWSARLPVLGLLVAAAVGARLGSMSASGQHVLTPAGVAAADHWAGVRAQLRSVGTFASKPAASVAMWDRMLAYATAMGLTARVAAELPLLSEHDTRAWSNVTGTWRQVRIRYWSVRPARGRHPAVAAVAGLALVALGAALLVLGARDARLLVRACAWAAGAPMVLVGAACVAAGCAAARRPLVVDGVVLRKRTRPREAPVAEARHRFLAIDDGREHRVVALRVRAEHYDRVGQGDHVRVVVRRGSAHVAALEVDPRACSRLARPLGHS
jgi:hypothetical protein